MNELKAILKTADLTNRPSYLATVVDVDGSAYRRPGARMLILSDGEHVGMISGGCLERDLGRQAAALCKKGSRLISFDTRSDSTNFTTRYNLGCNGIIYILVEPVTGGQNCPLRAIREVFSSRQPQVIGTVYHSEGFHGVTVGDRVSLAESQFGEASNAQLQYIYEQVAKSGRPVCCQLDGDAREVDSNARIFVEKLAPAKPFWIFGSGNDAIPMARIANELGWDVTVIGDRPNQLTAGRFPTANRLFVDCVKEAISKLNPTENTAAVLMTHSFNKDAIFLPWLCKLPLAYIGLLGPKVRTGKLLKRLHANGTFPDLSTLDRLHTPVGLDIGATNPAQIAISIAAEIIAIEHGRSGESLSQRNEPIHEPVSHELIGSSGLAHQSVVEQ